MKFATSKNFDKAVELFKPLSKIPQKDYERATPEARHFIEIARVWAPYNNLKSRDAGSNGWIPEAIMGVVENNNKDLPFLIKPNPTDADLEIQLAEGSYEIIVFDAVGKLILTKNTEGSNHINTSNWQNGIYFVKITDKSNNEIRNNKVVVQH